MARKEEEGEGRESLLVAVGVVAVAVVVAVLSLRSALHEYDENASAARPFARIRCEPPNRGALGRLR